jgi:hypothetical protein
MLLPRIAWGERPVDDTERTVRPGHLGGDGGYESSTGQPVARIPRPGLADQAAAKFSNLVNRVG